MLSCCYFMFHLFQQVLYLIPVTLTVGVIAAFQIPAFTERQNLGAITLLLVLFGLVNWEEVDLLNLPRNYCQFMTLLVFRLVLFLTLMTSFIGLI